MSSATRSPRQTVEQLLRSAVGATPGDMADCYAPEAVIEMPFAVDALYPPRIVTTREEPRARFQAGAATRRYKTLNNVTIHETADPVVIIAEYELHGERTGTGEPFSVRYAMVITVQDGHIVHSRDYTDPDRRRSAPGQASRTDISVELARREACLERQRPAASPADIDYPSAADQARARLSTSPAVRVNAWILGEQLAFSQVSAVSDGGRSLMGMPATPGCTWCSRKEGTVG